MSEALLFTVDEGVAVISVNDAPYNRMSLEFVDKLESLVNNIADDNNIRAVVMTAEGLDNFSVGMDLMQLGAAMQQDFNPHAFFDQRLRMIAAIENMGKPWVVTLFGYCLGAGLELPLGCHFRLAAAEGAQIGLPEMDLGSVPAWGGSARLSKCVGRDHTLDMILRGKKISGSEALRIGLVHEVWPLQELKQRAMDLARELASQPALAVKGVMNVAVGSEDRDLNELLKTERAAVLETFGTPDQQEGMLAFIEKRKPVFNQMK
ncbi:crotonase [Halioglobus japonicus]|uniref:Enoyl-CoA hydratase/isomerase family protein n=1 Tax=Halioglobus japonicus TaxID=930805 RepID=A0AAP8MH37_9GAMM|nr:enoyl-CoA hydratase/isomerase family protein [Halioglobus japonicus]AQA19290.1 crotonase [Halioglobus japonicus]PLW87672.1 enoyl-CoA hydratase/isomerase family protein [Halioglobus japonicus]GHD07191.1 enoyl-CoA hydratase [Halioglobus japonicus]